MQRQELSLKKQRGCVGKGRLAFKFFSYLEQHDGAQGVSLHFVGSPVIKHELVVILSERVLTLPPGSPCSFRH